jgi:hypothetical protein
MRGLRNSVNTAGSRSLRDQLPFKLGLLRAPHYRLEREDAEHQAAFWRRRVDRRPMSGKHLEVDASGCQVLHGIDQVVKVTTETVELPHQ